MMLKQIYLSEGLLDGGQNLNQVIKIGSLKNQYY